MLSQLARRAVSGFSFSTVAEGALRTWGRVREGERGPADPADAFTSGAWVGDNNVPTAEGFFRVGLLGKGDEVFKLVDSSLTPLLRGNAESSCTRHLEVSVSAFPHLKLTATAWPGGGGAGHPR